MKLIRSFSRFTPLLLKNRMKFNQQNNKYILPGIALLSYGFLLGTQKIFAEEMMTVETEDNLQ